MSHFDNKNAVLLLLLTCVIQEDAVVSNASDSAEDENIRDDFSSS